MKKSCALLMVLMFLGINSSLARRAYSSVDSDTMEVEVEENAGGQKVGFVTDWHFVKTIEGDDQLKQDLLDAAEDGGVTAMYHLGCMYFHGKGFDQNYPEAFRWLKTAAFKGNAPSQNNLGYMHEEGKGTKINLPEAFKWYKLAADYGNAAAQCNLGYMYEFGKGVPASTADALKWYQESAQRGNVVAKRNVYMMGGFDKKTDETQLATNARQTQPTQNTTTDQKIVQEKTALVPAKGTASKVAQAPTQKPTTQKIANDQKQATKPAAADAKPTVPAKPSTPASLDVAQQPTTPSSDTAAQPEDPGAAGSPTLTAILKRLGGNANLERLDRAKTGSLKDIFKRMDENPVLSANTNAASIPAATKDEPKVVEPNKVAEAPKSVEKQEPAKVAEAPKPVEKQEPTKVAEAPKPIEKQEPVKVAEAPKPVEKQEPVKVAEAPKPVEKQEPAKVAEAPKPVEKQEPAKVAEAPKPTEKQEPVKVAEAPKPVEKQEPVKVAEAPKPVEKQEPAKVAEAPKPVEKQEPAKVAEAPKPDVKEQPKQEPTKVSAAPKTKLSKTETPTKVAMVGASTEFPTTLPQLKQTVKPESNGKPVRDKWALVVGISKFDKQSIPKLRYSSKDASDFYNYLVKEANFQPDHVRLLLDEKATQRRLMSELGSKFLARVAKPDDLVVLFFSTHGSPSQMDVRGKNYIVAYDSDPDDLFATGIEMQKILESIQNRVLTDRVLLVLDACHSGFAAPAKGMSRAGNFDAEALAQGSGQLVICSSQPDEQSWESTRYQNGVFTRKLLEGLRTAGPNTTLVEAYTRAKKDVADEVKEDRPGARQTPILKGKWDGNDLILGVKAAAPQIVPFAVKNDLESDSSVAVSTPAVERRPRAFPKPPVLMASNATANSNSGFGGPQQPKQLFDNNSLTIDSSYFSCDGDPKALIKEYFTAIKANPKAELYFLRAKAHIQLKDWNNACSDLGEALQMVPNRSMYYVARAYVYYKLGRSVLSQEDLQQARFYDKRVPASIEFKD